MSNRILDLKKAIGVRLAKALNIKRVKDDRTSKSYNPPRYRLGPDQLTKTAAGLCDTIISLAEEAKKELASMPAERTGSPFIYERGDQVEHISFGRCTIATDPDEFGKFEVDLAKPLDNKSTARISADCFQLGKIFRKWNQKKDL